MFYLIFMVNMWMQSTSSRCKVDIIQLMHILPSWLWRYRISTSWPSRLDKTWDEGFLFFTPWQDTSHYQDLLRSICSELSDWPVESDCRVLTITVPRVASFITNLARTPARAAAPPVVQVYTRFCTSTGLPVLIPWEWPLGVVASEARSTES